jgi:riboflavin synthase
MFTGIITDIGRVLEVAEADAERQRQARSGAGRRMTIGTRLPLAEIPLGGSIATSGICFTAVDKGADWFTVEASGATLEVTTAGSWTVGDSVNLERSLRIGDEMGGHIVFGHVDAVGEILALEPAGESHRLEVRVPETLAPLVAIKGSIAVDGISLTVNEVGADRFAINIIPHSWRATNLAERKAGDRVNVEVDMLARYVARQLAFRREI